MSDIDERVLRYARIAIEETFGSIVDVDTHEDEYIDIDIASIGLDAPSDPVLRYDGGMARSVRTHRPGAYIPEGNLEYGWDILTIAHILYLTFGQIETTEGDLTIEEEEGEKYIDDKSELHEHRFTPHRHSLTLPSATFRLGKDHFEHVFQGVTVNSISFSLDDDFAFVTVDVSAQKDSADDIKEIEELTLSQAYPVAFYEALVEIGVKGESQEEVGEVESLSLEITNNTDPNAGINLGSRYPQRIIAGDFEVSGSMDIAFDSKEQLEHFWGKEDEPSDVSQDEMNINFRFKSAPYIAEIEDGESTEDVEIQCAELDLHIPTALYETVNLQPSGRSRLVQSVDFRGYYDDDSEYEVIATLYNHVNYPDEYSNINEPE